MFAVGGALLLAAGCGGGNSSNPLVGAKSATQVKIGDAPADRVISFEVSVGPVTLTPSGGGAAVTVLSTARRVELTHLSGTNEPLALLNVPQGSYSSATLTVANAEVEFINNLGLVTHLQSSASQSITVNFSTALNVGTSASVVNIDLNLANSLNFDAQGNVTGFNLTASSFGISTSAVAAQNQQEAEDGELEDTTGQVTAVSGSSFTLTLGQGGAQLTFTTDASTQFSDGLTDVNSTLNQIVKVEGVTKPDGTLYAKEVEGIENQNGTELEGLVTQVTGNPATQLTMVAQDGTGSGMDSSKLGATFTVDVSGAQYKVHKGNLDTSGIGGLPAPPNFPFDATTIHAGQRVEIESASALPASGPIVADKVKLDQQALTGTVSGLSGATTAGPATFTLTVAADSAFATLSGKTTVNVSWQPGTDLHKLASVNNGDTVRVRGLVFFTGAGFNMIARRISQ